MTKRPLFPRVVLRHCRPLLSLAALLAGAVGCVYDPNHRCDDYEVLSADGRQCVCMPGAAMTAHGCTLCGANEVAGNGTCDCVAGYSRPAPGLACQQVPSAQGAACDTLSAPCTDPTYTTCHVTNGTAGYCTNVGCTTSAECPNGYACAVDAQPPYCRRPPVGAGRACQTSADCASSEATYCDSFMTHQCLVQGCALAPDNCFAGTVCCDLTSFGVPQPICVQSGTCPT
jgi:hypothetical protein